MNDLVSVCIPVFNGEKYLAQCLDSVISQSHKNIEILIVDDGSTDKSLEIASQFREDKRVSLVTNEKNLGLVENWNKCLELANGEWVKLHFQDDTMVSDTISKMLYFASNQDIDIVLSDREYMVENGSKFVLSNLKRLSDYYKKETVIQPEELSSLFEKIGLGENFIGEPILGLLNKRIIRKYGDYDSSLEQIVDYEFWLRVGLNVPIGFIPDKLHRFRIHNDSQGAKNINKEIIPTFMDLVKIAAKMKADECYRTLRIMKNYPIIKKMILDDAFHHIKRYGYFKVKNIVGEEKIRQLNPPVTTIFKGIFTDIMRF